ncbi:MAG: DUF2807 domain-containing protein [Saprospiraceae bacterium]
MKISNIILAVLIGGLGLSMIVDIATSQKDGVAIEGVTLSGKRATRSYDAIALKHLNIEGPIKVILSAGIPKLTIEADEGLLDELMDKDTDPERLSIELPHNTNGTGGVTVSLSTPTLETITLSGSGSIVSTESLPYKSNVIRFEGSPSADLTYSDADLIKFSGSGGTNATLKGKTKRFEAAMSGGNEIIADELFAQVVDISGSGSTEALVHADSILNFSAAGSSSLRYTGTPKVSFSSSGSGRLEAI